MATAEMVMAGLAGQINAALAGVSPLQVMVDWPPQDLLQSVGRGETSVVSLFDRNLAKDKTRWISQYTGGQTLNTAGTIATASAVSLDPSGTGTVTLTGTPAVGDNIGVSIRNGLVTHVAVYTAISGDTLNSCATNLAAAINADTSLSTWISAAAVGAVVTLTNKTLNRLLFGSATGSFGTLNREIRRVCRDIQVSVWCYTNPLREQIGTLLDQRFSTLQSQYGFAIKNPPVLNADGSSVRVEIVDDVLVKDLAINDLYARHFVLACEYGVLLNDAIYTLIEPVLNYSGFALPIS